MKPEFKEKIEMEANYGAGVGVEQRNIYKCPCGKGEIIEDHCDIPGFRERDVYIACDECNENWIVKGNSSDWKIEPKHINPKHAIVDQECDMMDDMTEGQLAEHLAENFND